MGSLGFLYLKTDDALRLLSYVHPVQLGQDAAGRNGNGSDCYREGGGDRAVVQEVADRWQI